MRKLVRLFYFAFAILVIGCQRVNVSPAQRFYLFKTQKWNPLP